MQQLDQSSAQSPPNRVAELEAALAEARRQQAATDEVLLLVQDSKGNPRPAFRTIIASAVRLCRAKHGAIFLFDGKLLQFEAAHGLTPEAQAVLEQEYPIAPRGLNLEAITTRHAVYAGDVLADPRTANIALARAQGYRSYLVVPMLRADRVVGLVALYGAEPKQFTEDQIRLLRTFAAQAVIAIENARLFEAEQTRTKEVEAKSAELVQSLEYQTAISDVLGVISRSPTKLQPVLDTIVQTAARLCHADWGVLRRRQGETYAAVATVGMSDRRRKIEERFPIEPSRTTTIGRVLLENRTIHLPDVLEDSDYVGLHSRFEIDFRSSLAVPLRRSDELAGVLALFRAEQRPFSPQQIALVETFADQAVIAIENARLLDELQTRQKELQESLEYQTAISGVLQVISRSPSNLQPVLDTIVETAERLCEADRAQIFTESNGSYQLAAYTKTSATTVAYFRENPIIPRRGRASGRALLEGRPVHIPDVTTEPDHDPYEIPAMSSGARLAVPLMSGGRTFGVISLPRSRPIPFTQRQIDLVSTFADQAVIAIENARLFEAEQARTRELAEALEHQTATSEVLEVVSSSPGRIEPVYDAILERALTHCDARFGVFFRHDAGRFHVVAHRGLPPALAEAITRAPFVPAPGTGFARAVGTMAPTQVADVQNYAAYADPEAARTDILRRAVAELGGGRTALGVPLVRDGRLAGVIVVYRTEVRAFGEKQQQLMLGFANQAVIAIENARLFEAEQTRTRELTESLEYQTAISEVLKVISQSPSALKPVFEAIVRVARQLCDAERAAVHQRSGDGPYVLLASDGPAPFDLSGDPLGQPVPIDRSSMIGRTVLAREPVQILDAQVEPGLTFLRHLPGNQRRSMLGVPLMQQGEVFGTITLTRTLVRPFSERQVALVSTFADQAVIAIENARLFEAEQTRTKEVEAKSAELAQSLEYQTATSEVLSVISQSPDKLQPVLDAIVETAARVCGVEQAQLLRPVGEKLCPAAQFGGYVLAARDGIPMTRGTVTGRAYLYARTIHVHDLASEIDTEYQEARAFQKEHGGRTVLATPLLRNGVPLGIILLRRKVVQPFTDQQIALLETFADQAVIAINNVGLFEEVQARTKELTESLEYQTATSDILRVIAASREDVQPVLQAVAETACRICDAYDAVITLRDGDWLQFGAHHGPISFDADGIPVKPTHSTGLAVMDGRPIHIPDIRLEADKFPDAAAMAERTGWRAVLAIPLMRDGRAIGAIGLRRVEPIAFTQKHIQLAETFADQAVIAIENARLLDELQTRTKELTESLEYQTATSDVLSVISKSPGALEPVFQAMLDNAVRVCGASFGNLLLYDGRDFRHVALHNAPGVWAAEQARDPVPPRDLARVLYRVPETKQLVHITDLMTVNPDEPIAAKAGARTLLIVPMLKLGELVGVIAVYRQEVRPFTEKQIELVDGFAKQAVIAIENARLLDELQTRQKELEARGAELAQSLEYQTATSEVLGVISRSPTEVQPVLDAIAATARKLCQSERAMIWRIAGDEFCPVAFSGIDNARMEQVRAMSVPLGSGSNLGRAVLAGKAVQALDPINDTTLSEANLRVIRTGNIRTVVAVPLLLHGQPIGGITVSRTTLSPFTDRQIELIETFADQAVIAINNAGLFEEVQARTKELAESLEYQTAISEVLGVISRSPDNLQPVLDAIASTARRLCEADDGMIYRMRDGVLHMRAVNGTRPELIERYATTPISPGRGSASGRAVIEKRAVHIADFMADPEFDYLKDRFDGRSGSCLSVPLLHHGEPIGVIALGRGQVHPFTQRQIDLVMTFADQAVIAINNVGLFEEVQARTKELTESLEYQTATSEVLGVISKSPNELQPVLDAITETASQLCDSEFAALFNVVGDKCIIAAGNNAKAEFIQYLRDNPVPVEPGSSVGRAAFERKTFHIEDVLTLPGYTRSASQKVGGQRTVLTVPLLRDGEAIGVIALMRSRVKAFTEKQIKLVETFADQAVIAMNNARLFEEVQARTKELTESLEYQTATSEVLSVISRSPTELQPVLDQIVRTAAKLGQADIVGLRRRDGESFPLVAHSGYTDEQIAWLAKNLKTPTFGALYQAIQTRKTQHVSNPLAGERGDDAVELAKIVGNRTALAVPLLRHGELIGTLFLGRNELRLFTDRQIALIETFADQAVIAINNVGLFEEVQTRTRELARSVEELKSLGEVGRAVSSTLDMPKMLQTVLENACKMAYAGGGTIYVYDKAADAFHLEAGYNMSEEHIERVRRQPIRMGDPVVGECGQRRETIQIEDLQQADRTRTALIDILMRAGVRAILAMPLIHQDQVIGALVVRRTYPGPFAAETIQLLEAFAAQSAIAVNNARLFNEITDKSRQLELASQHKSQFLANMSHELRTPLNAILGYTELMQDGIYGGLPEKAGGVLDRVQSNGQHLLGLINQVLDLSKIEAGQLRLNIADYSVSSIVETVVAATESLATEKKLKLSSEVALEIPRGRGDEQRIVQVLLNLVGNAIKFTDKGEIRIQAGAFAGRFQIAVVDTGPGIAPAEQERIFEEFHQVDSSNTKAKGGTGLGLAIAKRIVEMHGGRISVDSTVGVGSTFRVELPVEAVDVQAQAGKHEGATA